MSDELSAAEQFDADLAKAKDPLGIIEPVAKADELVDTPNTADAPDGDRPFDPETLPPSARAEWDKLNRQLQDVDRDRRSLRNRVPNLQRELAQKERLLRERMEPKAEKAEVPKAPDAKAGQSAADYFESPAWKKYLDTYPEEAEPILAAFRAQEETHKRLYSELETKFGKVQAFIDDELPKRFSAYDDVLNAHKQHELDAKVDELDTAVPNWEDHIHVQVNDGKIEIDHISEPMQKWLEKQPRAVVNMMISDDIEEVTAAFSAFENWMHRQAAPSTEQRNATTLRTVREKNLSRRVGPTVKGEGVARPAATDAAIGFDLRMRQLQSG